MTYGLIHWGNSSYAEMVFKMQKRVVRLMMGRDYRESCRDLFKEIILIYIYIRLTWPNMVKEYIIWQ
jgi:hypothetical protein